MNLFAFTGNIGGDVKVNNAGGTAVANFSVAVKAGYGDKAQTIWIACAVWGKQAESKLVDYLVKGQGVAVSGELSTREHDGKTFLQVRVGTIDLVGGSKSDGGSSQPKPQQSKPQQSQQAAPPDSDPFDPDIPFAPAHYLAGI